VTSRERRVTREAAVLRRREIVKNYRVIKDDVVADAIWAFWRDVGMKERYVPGSIASSLHLAEYLRERGLAGPAVLVEEITAFTNAVTRAYEAPTEVPSKATADAG